MTKTLHVPGQIRRHVLKQGKPDSSRPGEVHLYAACQEGAAELERQGRNSLNSIDLHLTNAAIGAALEIARDWLTSDNGNNVMAGKSMLKFELEYEPDDPREIRHEIKMPKSVAGHFAPQYGSPSPYKSESEIIQTDMHRMSWTSTGAHGRVRAETLGFILRKMDRLKYHDHSAVARAAKKFLDTYTEQYEQTQRLINGYLGTGEDQDQEPEKVRRLVIIPCSGKKSEEPGLIPAEERYTGNYHVACRMAAEVMDGPTMVLSAKHGLITLDEEIENYNVTFGDRDAITAANVKDQAAELGLLDAKVTVLGGERYVKVVREVWPDAEAPLKGGIGQQLKQLAGIYSGEALALDGPEEYHEGQLRDIPSLPSRGRSQEPVIWYGGKAGVAYFKPQGWRKARITYTGEGKYDLTDAVTRELIRTGTLRTQLYWAPVDQEEQPPAAEVEVKDPLLDLIAETTPPPGGYEVPANFLELAEEGNTDQAKAYWKRRCEEYRRTGK